MKRLVLIILVVSLFTIGGCSQNSASAARQKAVRPETKEAAAEQAKPKPVLTAKDLKLKTKSSPQKKYNGLSLRQARRERQEAQRSQANNSNATSNSGSNYNRRNPI